jgi:predicted DNA-binding transcriptional regulator AlpA
MPAMQSETKTAVQQVISVDDVAEHFDVSTRTIWSWVAHKEFPAPLRIGRRMRYWASEEINKWIEAGCPKISND